jgi:hypothetical protein
MIKMIKFSWEKINNRLGWNGYKVLGYFYYKQNISTKMRLNTSKEVINFAHEPYPDGPCFLVNINEALENTTDPGYLYNYLELASKRNIFDYKMRGIKALPVILVPEYLEGFLSTNPMLEVKNGNVYFKFE